MEMPLCCSCSIKTLFFAQQQPTGWKPAPNYAKNPSNSLQIMQKITLDQLQVMQKKTIKKNT